MTPSVPRNLRHRAILLLGLTLGATPAFAQDNSTAPTGLESFSLPPGNQVAPPVVQPTPQNQVAPVTPPPVRPTVPTPAPTTAAPTPTPSPAATRSPPPRQPGPAIAVPPAPAPVVTEAPVPTDPLADPLLPAPVEPAPAPETQVAEPADPTTGYGVWPFVALAFAVAALALVLALRRRRRRRDAALWSEEVIAPEPAETSAPPPVEIRDPVGLAEQEAAPIDAQQADAAEGTTDAIIVEPAPADIDALATATVAATDRPWLEFALRPVKAGTNVVDAVVEFELTIANTSAVAAEDVRIAAWLLSASPTQDADIARFLELPPEEAVMAPIAIDAGDGKRVDAAIAFPKNGLNVVHVRDRPFFVPLIVADARYRLPDGGEGRTSAAFVVGTVKPGGEKLGPIWLDRGPRMHDNVEARLHGTAIRA